MFLIQKIIDYLFPKQCIICSKLGAYLCKTCKRLLQPHPEICPICHRFSRDYKICLNCKGEKEIAVEGIIIPFVYDDILKKLIIKLKYYHKKDISKFLIERLTLALETNQSFQNLKLGNANATFITRIPTHRYREYFIKGYNQSKILAKQLSKITGIPRIQIAKKIKYTKTQASLNREGRLKNLKNAFSLVKDIQLQGNETLLIVDDITTTGSTINELAKLIKFHYPKVKIRGAVLGRHIK